MTRWTALPCVKLRQSQLDAPASGAFEPVNFQFQLSVA